ncbi:hypothetical protein VTN00DRAFT_9235 [Thermoascus crustaceus]|uniref:uncharacterized protein n=1 Tax=Thermoascus crustaceus TaxID=5088 RepID=UPI00374312CE
MGPMTEPAIQALFEDPLFDGGEDVNAGFAEGGMVIDIGGALDVIALREGSVHIFWQEENAPQPHEGLRLTLPWGGGGPEAE